MSDAVSIGRRFFEELLGKGDASVADEILADNIVMYHPSSPTPITPRAAVQGFLGAFRAGFPDMHICLLYTSPSPRDRTRSRMPSSA